jgi:hypothetical protein
MSSRKRRTSGITSDYVSATQSIIACRDKVPEPEDGPTAPAMQLNIGSEDCRARLLSFHLMVAEMDNDRDGRKEFIARGDSASLVLLDPNNFALDEEEHIAFKGLSRERTDVQSLKLGIRSTSSTSTVPDKQGSKTLIAGLAFGVNEDLLLSYMMPMKLPV